MKNTKLSSNQCLERLKYFDMDMSVIAVQNFPKNEK